MARPRKQHIPPEIIMILRRESGLSHDGIAEENAPSDEGCPELPERLRHMLHILRNKPVKATDMIYLIMYDIENDKIRNAVAKYLISKGCIRIQKSVFIARTSSRLFQEIFKAMKEIQQAYENNDSIILAPINTTDVRSMKIVGKNITLESITDPPDVLFV